MLTQNELKQIIHYDPDTGAVTWKHRPVEFFKRQRDCNAWNARYAGKVAGRIYQFDSGKSYRQLTLFGKTKREHRLIWLYMTGSEPTDQIDHDNGDGTDNRWDNLSDITGFQNNRNKRKPSDNTSGVVGVYWDKHYNKWLASLNCDGKRFNLGRYTEWFDAVCARKSAENNHDFHKNHGSIRPL